MANASFRIFRTANEREASDEELPNMHRHHSSSTIDALMITLTPEGGFCYQNLGRRLRLKRLVDLGTSFCQA